MSDSVENLSLRIDSGAIHLMGSGLDRLSPIFKLIHSIKIINMGATHGHNAVGLDYKLQFANVSSLYNNPWNRDPESSRNRIFLKSDYGRPYRS